MGAWPTGCVVLVHSSAWKQASSRWARGQLAASSSSTRPRGSKQQQPAGSTGTGAGSALRPASDGASGRQQAETGHGRMAARGLWEHCSLHGAEQGCRPAGTAAQSADGVEGGTATEPSARREACLRASGGQSGKRSRIAQKLGFRLFV
jgi:hypothetical protein